MNDLLRFPNAVRLDPQIEAWFFGFTDPLRLMTRTWFERMRGCGVDVRELLHDGCPVACVEDAPFGYVNAFRAHANVGFYYGAMLADPAGLLEGTGKRMRHVKLRPGKELDVEALSDLAVGAYHDITLRLRQPNLRGSDRLDLAVSFRGHSPADFGGSTLTPIGTQSKCSSIAEIEAGKSVIPFNREPP